MTPFGQALRRMRARRGIAQKDMASALGVSAAYLSALEHGHRGRPSWDFVQKVIGYFNVIWDDAEELQALAGLSDPKVVIDTAGMSPAKTAVANRLAANIVRLDDTRIARIDEILDEVERP